MLRDNNTPPALPVVLTIAGSDSGGGAGIQADLKAFMALGCHGLSAIAALTAQNTRGVSAVHHPPLPFLAAQLEAVFDDFEIAAVKIGMLGTAPVVELVARVLAERGAANVVLDPVLVASSGARLSDDEALAALRERLLPLADLLTPNLPEAEALLGRSIGSEDDAQAAARSLAAQVRGGVLLKGGHGAGPVLVDHYLERGQAIRSWRHPRLPLQGHGTGCTLAAALAAHLARGLGRPAAADAAIGFLQAALAAAYRPGRGTVHVLDPMAAALALRGRAADPDDRPA